MPGKHSYLKIYFGEGETPCFKQEEEYVVLFKCLEKVNPELKEDENGRVWPPQNLEWCLINKKDVTETGGRCICKDYHPGIVEVKILKQDKKKATILIKDCKEGMNKFVVPLRQIIQ